MPSTDITTIRQYTLKFYKKLTDKLPKEKLHHIMSIYQSRTEKNQNNNDVSTNNIDKTSSLDPHLSIYELLERSNNLIIHSEDNSEMEHHNDRDTEEDTILGQSNGLKNLSINSSQNLIKEVPMTLENVTHSKEGEKLPESWLNIQRNEITNSLHIETSNSQTNTVGILSSSDTSEEELDTQNSPSPQKTSIMRQNNSDMTNKNIIQCLNDTNNMSLNLNSHFVTGDIPTTKLTSIGFNQLNEEDSITLTKSISSSGSYVMPKLSITRKNGNQVGKVQDSKFFKILVLGRIGLQFYRSIPQKYQYLFNLPRTYDSNEYCNYNGIIIVIEEISELMSILNRVSKRVMDSIPVTTVTPESDNLLQIKNIMNSYVRRNLIATMYPPFVMTNKNEINNLFTMLSGLEHDFVNQRNSLSKERRISSSSLYVYTSQSSSDASDSSESLAFSSSNKRLKKLQYQNGSKINEYILSHQESDVPPGKRKTNRKPKRRNKSITRNRWFIWGISLSVGVGIGYCLSYFNVLDWVEISIKKYLQYNNNRDIKDVTNVTSCKAVSFFKRILAFFDNERDSDSHDIFHKTFRTVKQCMNDATRVIKSNFHKTIIFLEEMHVMTSKDNKLSSANNQENNQSKLFALGYILL